MLQQQQNQYEKCPKHAQNDIILFCVGGQCMEPLCKECCKEHVSWHNSYNSKAELETVDQVRQKCLSDVHNLKVRFEEERAILKHFSDSENSDLVKSAHQKLDQVKQRLQQMVNEYCAQLEAQIKQKVSQHRSAHPGEKKELHNRLNQVILELDNKEKGLLQQKYLRSLLLVMTEEKSHDLEGFANEIDGAVKHYLQNMFDVFVHDDKLYQIKNDLQSYVAVEEASLEAEIEIYTKKLRSGEQVYGMDQNGNPVNTRGMSQPARSTYQSSRQQPIFPSSGQSGYNPSPATTDSRQSAYQRPQQGRSYESPQNLDLYKSSQVGESNNKRLKSKYDL